MKLINLLPILISISLPLYCQWAEFPVEKYKYFEQNEKPDLKIFGGVGKMFISLQAKNVEFIGVEYKDQMTVDNNEEWTEVNGPFKENPIYNFAFSEYEITQIYIIDSLNYKFHGNEKNSYRDIEGFVKLKKSGKFSTLR